jgi:hypothetical protein
MGVKVKFGQKLTPICFAHVSRLLHTKFHPYISISALETGVGFICTPYSPTRYSAVHRIALDLKGS